MHHTSLGQYGEKSHGPVFILFLLFTHIIITFFATPAFTQTIHPRTSHVVYASSYRSSQHPTLLCRISCAIRCNIMRDNKK